MMKRKSFGIIFLTNTLLLVSFIDALSLDVPSFRISDIPGLQARPGVAYGSTTNQYLAVWEDFRNATIGANDVYGQLVNADGSLAGTNFNLSSAAERQNDPKPVFNPASGRYLVVWEDWRNATDDVYGRQVNANGTLYGTELVISNGANDQSNPDIVYNPASNQFLVVFDDDRLVAYDYDIYGKLVNADGTPSGNDFPISTPSDNQLLPVVAYNSMENQFLVVWRDGRNASTSDDIYARLVNANGSLDGGDFAVSTANADQDYPDVAYDSYSNQYLVVWEQSADVYARLVRADGSFNGPDFRIASGPGSLSSPAVAFDPNSRQFLVIWSDSEGWDNLYARQVGTDGSMPEPQFDFAYGTGNYIDPNLALNTQTNQFLAVWRHMVCLTTFNCEDTGNNTKDIYGGFYRAAGSYSVHLPVALRGHQPAPPPSPTATTPVPTPMPTSLPGGWEAIVAEDFEGGFPGDWQVYDDNGSTGGEYNWAASTCRAYSGGASGWAVGGGTDGATLACGSYYPNEADSWLVYGPFDLSDATAAELLFKAWYYTETDFDYFYWTASIDNSDFYGLRTSGDSGGWVDLALDLTNVHTLGDLTGEPAVWVALIFQSDGSLVLPEGVHVDNILLRKCTGGSCTLAAASRPGGASGQVPTFPAERSIGDR